MIQNQKYLPPKSPIKSQIDDGTDEETAKKDEEILNRVEDDEQKSTTVDSTLDE